MAQGFAAVGTCVREIAPLSKEVLSASFSDAERADIDARAEATGVERTSTGMLAAKGALMHALGVEVPFRDIELVRHDGGSLKVELSGEAALALEKKGAREAQVSITYANDTAHAAAMLLL